MKSKYTKTILPCIVMFVFIVAAACNNAGEANEKTPQADDGKNSVADAAEIEEATEPLNPRLLVSDDLPEMDYGGYDFDILYITHRYYTSGLYYAEDETSDVLNGAVYRRKRDVEEGFNVKINWVPEDGDIGRKVSSAVKSGDDIYDLVLTHCISSVADMATSGLILDFNRISGFNFEKPWWNQTMNETLSIGGVLLYAVSDFIVPEPNAIFFNKALQKEYGIEDLYGLVKSGKWTLDKFIEISKMTSKDLNGDGVFDENDQYGLIMELDWMLLSFMYASDQTVCAQLPGDPYPTVSMNNQKMTDIVEKVYDLCYGGNQTFMFLMPPGDWPLDFDSGRSLFVVKPLSSAKQMRAMDVDFGIVPFPKFDEGQKDYVNNSWNGLMCIPNVASDPERTATIIEALSAESYKRCIPAYTETLLKSKVARDDESLEMIDIIFNNCTYDVGMNFITDNAFLYSLYYLMKDKETNFASYYEKNAPHVIASYNKIFEAVIKNYKNQ